MKRYLPVVIVAVVAVATVVGGVMLYRAKKASLNPVPRGVTVASDATDAGHVLGPPKAAVTLEEFGDYQCPPCGRLASVIDQIERDYRPHLRVVFRNFPFAIHPHAQEAALAAEAAALQGRFWEMHDLLYKEQPFWSSASDVRPVFQHYAEMIGLDPDRFKKDMDGEQTRQRVVADQRRGSLLGVTQTPSIFINRQPLSSGSLNVSGLRAAIDAAMKSTPTG